MTSELGHGTCFTLDVPCVPAEIDEEEEDADPVDISARPPASSGDDSGIVRVLVVDDNSVNRLLITTFLDSFGMAFKAVGSGKAALTSMEHDEFDVIVMDLQMPDMDGLEASLRLRETEKGADIPIVALTAGMKPADTARCRRARFSAVLGKPFAPADLLKALTDAVALIREKG